MKDVVDLGVGEEEDLRALRVVGESFRSMLKAGREVQEHSVELHLKCSNDYVRLRETGK